MFLLGINGFLVVCSLKTRPKAIPKVPKLKLSKRQYFPEKMA